MLTLKSNERHDEILKLDPKTGVAAVGSRRAESLPLFLSGHFARSNDTYVCLYRWDDRVYFRVGEEAYMLPDNCVATLQDEGGHRMLQIRSGELEICRWIYRKPETDLIDCLSNVEEEDRDFGVFVHNVINDRDRLYRMYR